MKKKPTPSSMLIASGLTVAVLIALHVSGYGPGDVGPEPMDPADTQRTSRTDPDGPTGAEIDAATTEAYRAQYRPNVMDTGAEADQKRLYDTMSRLGTSPVEFVGLEGSDTSELVVGNTETDDADIESLVAEGGHYSGPRYPRRDRDRNRENDK